LRYFLFKSIKLKRTPCYGSCPVYEVEILANGTVNYNGEMFVEMDGAHSWKIEPENIELLNQLICKYDYFNIQKLNTYKRMTCIPSCITTIELQDGIKRTIENDYGERKYPRLLETFENRIDLIVGIRKNR
jgi:hypothetical protein